MSDHENEEETEESPRPRGNPDENTLRIMVSTDNHYFLGNNERHVVRGMDSFAAFIRTSLL